MSFAHLHICTQHFLCLDIISYLIFYIYFIFLWLAASCQPCSTCLHIPLCTVMLILIFNSTAYCHAHSFIFYILFFISYFLFILFYEYFPCVVFFNICTVQGADPTLISLLVIQSLYSRVCDNKTWNLKLEFSDFWAISYCFVQIVMLIRIQCILFIDHSIIAICPRGALLNNFEKGQGSSPQSPPFCTCLHPWVIPLHFHIQHMVC